MARLVVVGATGQLARALQFVTLPPGFDLCVLGRDRLDLADRASIPTAIDAARPDVVINAAAYTAVDRAETESRAAFAINAVGVGALAAAAWAHRAPFLHVSTDYVFDGAGERPWREDDPVGPLNLYGASKLAGEIAALGANPRTTIIRTSWVFSSTGSNFVRTMLRLAKSRDVLQIVDDQRGRPTGAADLAMALVACLAPLSAGELAGEILHVSNAGPVVSWCGFAEAIFAAAAAAARGGRRPTLVPIPTEAYPTPARRPRNSALDITRFEAKLGHRPASWPDALARVVQELAALGEI